MDMLNKKVVKPLIEQVTERDNTIKNLTDERDKLQTNLKMLHAILRSPKMTDLYSKQMRKKMTGEEIEKSNKKAYIELYRSNVNVNNADQIISQLAHSVNETL